MCHLILCPHNALPYRMKTKTDALLDIQSDKVRVSICGITARASRKQGRSSVCNKTGREGEAWGTAGHREFLPFWKKMQLSLPRGQQEQKAAQPLAGLARKRPEVIGGRSTGRTRVVHFGLLFRSSGILCAHPSVWIGKIS